MQEISYNDAANKIFEIADNNHINSKSSGDQSFPRGGSSENDYLTFTTSYRMQDFNTTYMTVKLYFISHLRQMKDLTIDEMYTLEDQVKNMRNFIEEVTEYFNDKVVKLN